MFCPSRGFPGEFRSPQTISPEKRNLSGLGGDLTGSLRAQDNKPAGYITVSFSGLRGQLLRKKKTRRSSAQSFPAANLPETRRKLNLLKAKICSRRVIILAGRLADMFPIIKMVLDINNYHPDSLTSFQTIRKDHGIILIVTCSLPNEETLLSPSNNVLNYLILCLYLFVNVEEGSKREAESGGIILELRWPHCKMHERKLEDLLLGQMEDKVVTVKGTQENLKQLDILQERFLKENFPAVNIFRGQLSSGRKLAKSSSGSSPLTRVPETQLNRAVGAKNSPREVRIVSSRVPPILRGEKDASVPGKTMIIRLTSFQSGFPSTRHKIRTLEDRRRNVALKSEYLVETMFAVDDQDSLEFMIENKISRANQLGIFHGGLNRGGQVSLREDPGTLSGSNGQRPSGRKFPGSLLGSSSESNLQETEPTNILSAKYHLEHVSCTGEHVPWYGTIISSRCSNARLQEYVLTEFQKSGGNVCERLRGGGGSKLGRKSRLSPIRFFGFRDSQKRGSKEDGTDKTQTTDERKVKETFLTTEKIERKDSLERLVKEETQSMKVSVDEQRKHVEEARSSRRKDCCRLCNMLTAPEANCYMKIVSCKQRPCEVRCQSICQCATCRRNQSARQVQSQQPCSYSPCSPRPCPPRSCSPRPCPPAACPPRSCSPQPCATRSCPPNVPRPSCSSCQPCSPCSNCLSLRQRLCSPSPCPPYPRQRSPCKSQPAISCQRQRSPCKSSDGCHSCNSSCAAPCPDERENPCTKCKCQTCKNSPLEGPCGGQSCGTINSCAGIGGGGSCFPRNTKRRSGSECCSATNSGCGGCC